MMHYPRILLLIGLCALVIFPVLGQAETRCLDRDTQFDYAADLLETGDSETARVEYKRFIRFFPDDEKLREAKFRIGETWLKQGEPVRALACFEDLIGERADDAWAFEAYFKVAQCHMLTGNPLLGEISLQNAMVLSDDPELYDRALNALAWIRLETGRFQAAGETFGKISDTGKETFKVSVILSALTQTPDIPRKSPKLAGTLAIVPGAGYLYLGRYRDALTAFLINGGLIFAAVESFDHDHYALGGVISFVEFGFYAGNIYGSATSAHKYNRQAARNFISTLKEAVTPSLGLIPDSSQKPRPALIFGARF